MLIYFEIRTFLFLHLPGNNLLTERSILLITPHGCNILQVPDIILFYLKRTFACDNRRIIL